MTAQSYTPAPATSNARHFSTYRGYRRNVARSNRALASWRSRWHGQRPKPSRENKGYWRASLRWLLSKYNPNRKAFAKRFYKR